MTLFSSITSRARAVELLLALCVLLLCSSVGEASFAYWFGAYVPNVNGWLNNNDGGDSLVDWEGSSYAKIDKLTGICADSSGLRPRIVPNTRETSNKFVFVACREKLLRIEILVDKSDISLASEPEVIAEFGEDEPVSDLYVDPKGLVVVTPKGLKAFSKLESKNVASDWENVRPGITTAVLSKDHVVFTQTDTNYVCMLDRKKGTDLVCGTTRPSELLVHGPLVDADDNVYVCSDTHLYKLSVSGVVLEVQSIPGCSAMILSAVDTIILAYDNKLQKRDANNLELLHKEIIVGGGKINALARHRVTVNGVRQERLYCSQDSGVSILSDTDESWADGKEIVFSRKFIVGVKDVVAVFNSGDAVAAGSQNLFGITDRAPNNHLVHFQEPGRLLSQSEYSTCPIILNSKSLLALTADGKDVALFASCTIAVRGEEKKSVTRECPHQIVQITDEMNYFVVAASAVAAAFVVPLSVRSIKFFQRKKLC